jgi:signal transduction histidine kinase/CheY-like chemotaxis protein/HPt (histidine-containing phosphotransfer) domain-containing protein
MRKIPLSRSLYWQLLFVTLAFTLMVVSSGIFVNNMLVNYLRRDAESIFMQTEIRIADELQEAETLTISVVRDVRAIIVDGGSAGDVERYFNDIYAELLKKKGGFIFDGVRGYFESLGNAYISAPKWDVPADFNPKERPWYKAAVEADDKITLSPMYRNLRAGIYVIDYACRIFNDEGEPLGVVSVSLQFNNISNFVRDIRIVEGGYGFLADENFVLAAHNETDFITKHMNDISPGFRQIVKLMEQGGSFIRDEGYNYQGVNSISFCKRLDNGWYLGIMTPKNVYYHDLRILISFLGVLGIVLMLAVNFILIRIDITKSKLDEAFREQHVQINKRLKQQSLMTSISQNFLSNEDMDALITKAFGMVGDAMDIDQILMHVTEDNGASYTCRDEWTNPKLILPTRLGGSFRISKAVWEIVQRLKLRGLIYITSNDPVVRKAIEPYRMSLYDYIITFVFLGDVLHADIVFSKAGNDHRWEQDEINLASYITSILVGALTRRSVELQLIAAKEAAEQSNSMKGIFLANMSHEIRTPMNAILGISEIQLQNTTLPPDAEEAFNQIYDSGNLLLNIINDILDFSKIEAGKMEIVPVKYDVPSLLNDTAQLNRLRYESKPIDFMLDVDENTPLELFGDELRIKQILNNLLSNAFKYTDEGKVELSVHSELPVHAEVKDKETVTLVFQVSDTGQGMQEDQVAKLFDAYSRFNMKANRAIAGTGLGMSIVKRLIEMMDGEISVKSEIGKGSTITVRLPQKNIGPAVCGAEFADNLRNFRFRSSPISKKAQIVHEYMPYGSVLVVDDVVSNIYVIRGLLKPYGLKIDTASSGMEAIEKIKDGGAYDIVFMDHMMPVMDGIKATEIIRGMGYTRTIIAFTANAIVGQSDMFLANGFDGFISKPIDSRELDAVVKSFIRDKQPHEVIEAVRREQRERDAEINDAHEIEKYFVLDAEKAIKVIEEIYPKINTSESLVINLYTTAVHGMKSALANIGETELSADALELEQAGREGNLAAITEKTPAFTDALRVLIGKYKPAETGETTEISGEDAVYLREKLLAIKTACEALDVTAARNALHDLKHKTWPRRVNIILDEISVHLLHSAFNKAAATAENALE